MDRVGQTPVALTIAGSDSGGGAGIQTDLKTFAALGCFGTCAITCMTAQNPDGVTGIEAASPSMVVRQIEAVCAGFPVVAAKTGMLYSAEIIHAVAESVHACAITTLVVDPVMVATSGARLLRDDAIEALCEMLPRAAVVTPNLPEAEILCGHAIAGPEALRDAAEEIGRRWDTAVLLKGGHVQDGRDAVVDVLFDGVAIHSFFTPRLAVRETHGTGCTFAAAMTACLAQGRSLAVAAEEAQAFVAAALANPYHAGTHWPLGVGKLS